MCDDAWKGPLTQAVFFIGSVPGLMAFSWISDNVGRLPTFLISNGVILVTGMVLPYCTDFYSFLVVRFLMGITYDTFFTSFFVLGVLKISFKILLYLIIRICFQRSNTSL